MREMTAKFNGSCRSCGGFLPKGSRILWTRETGATHRTEQECDAARRKTAQPTPAPVATFDSSSIVAFLAGARERGLKAPKVHFLHERGGLTQEIILSLAKDTGRNPGAVYVKVDGEYVGLIAADGGVRGSWEAGDRSLTNAPGLLDTIGAIAADPAKAAKAYGALRGCCSFCSLKLTDAGSVEVGYGPICADKFGLPHKSLGTRAAQVIAA